MPEKRLFFGAEVTAPWPRELPEGRLIPEEGRHLTLAFLGQTDFDLIYSRLNQFPAPAFKVGLAGKSDRVIFLPEKTPRVAACEVKWLMNEELLFSFQKNLIQWLSSLEFTFKNDFLSHVTVARSPHHFEKWKAIFLNMPFVLKAVHLYESTGNLTYVPLWTYPLIAPFEEIEHTADIAFIVRGETIQQLHLNAQIAICFKSPSFLAYMTSLENDLDDIVIALNDMISKADEEIGSPFKAVSFHGNIEDRNGILEWRMIIDV